MSSVYIHTPPEIRTRPSIEITYNIGSENEENSIYRNNQTSIALLKKIYNFHNASEIENYLNQNNPILDSLLEGNIEIREIFTNIKEVSLELHEDFEEDFEQLFIVIKSTNGPEELLTMLNKLDDEWFLQLPYDIINKFNITVKSI